MSLEEIMARAREAGKQKQEQEQKKEVGEEIKTYEVSQEQLAAKQQRLEQISARKQEDEQKIAEIRQGLKGSTGFNKVKKEIQKIGQESGLEETQVNQFIQEAKDERRTIVEGKLSQRQERQQVRSGINELDNEATGLQDEIANTEKPTLSDEAKTELNNRNLEEAQQTYDQSREEAIATFEKIKTEWDDELEKFHPQAAEAQKKAEEEATSKGLSSYGINNAGDKARRAIMDPVYKRRDSELLQARDKMDQTIEEAETALQKVKKELRTSE